MSPKHSWSCRKIGLHPKIPADQTLLVSEPVILSKSIPKLLNAEKPSSARSTRRKSSSAGRPNQSTSNEIEISLGIPDFESPDDFQAVERQFLSKDRAKQFNDPRSKVSFRKILDAEPFPFNSKKLSLDASQSKRRYKYLAQPHTQDNETVVLKTLNAEKAKENVKHVISNLEEYLYRETTTEPLNASAKDTSVVDTVLNMVDPILKTSEGDKPTLFLQPEEDAPAELLDYIECQLGIQLDTTVVKGWPNPKTWPVPMTAASIRTRRPNTARPCDDDFSRLETNKTRRTKGGPWYLPRKYWFNPIPRVALSKYSEIRLEQELLREEREQVKKNSVSYRLQQLTQKSKNEYQQLEAKYGLNDMNSHKVAIEIKDGTRS